MLPRSLTFAGLLGAAVGVPYAVTNAPNDWNSGWQASPPPPAEAPPQDPLAGLALQPPHAGAPEGPNAAIYASPARLEGPVGQPIEQVLRWDIDRNWVYQQWARKSTGLADPELFGIRVPLVTGYGMTDLAGSLSYYFNANGALERIRFYGRTADTTRIVHLLTTRFGLQPRTALSPGEQLYQAVEKGGLRAQLRTSPESVMWGTAPHESFLVRLELNRPGSTRWVEPERPQLNLPGVEPPVADAAQKNQGQPFLPPRSVVPDQAAPPSGAQGAAASEPPAPPTVGAPTQAPATDIKPLTGHRDQFRWPN